MQRSILMKTAQFPHWWRESCRHQSAALILRRLDRRVTLLPRDGHFATARGTYETFFLWRNRIHGLRFRRGSGRSFRSLKRFDRAIQFVAFCDEKGDDVVGSHRAILSCDQGSPLSARNIEDPAESFRPPGFVKVGPALNSTLSWRR